MHHNRNLDIIPILSKEEFMAKASLTDRRAKLAEKQRQITAKLKTLDARAAAQLRKDETRRKVIIGALALRHAELNPESGFARQTIALIANEIETAANPRARETIERLFAGVLPTKPEPLAEPEPAVLSDHETPSGENRVGLASPPFVLSGEDWSVAGKDDN
jgi:hypothetical protein